MRILVIAMFAALAATACEKKETAATPPAAASAKPQAAPELPRPPVGIAPPEAEADDDVATAEDFADEAEKDITAANVEAEVDKLEKEIGD